MPDLLRDKCVVVTGAASGIGRAVAITAARHGAKAVLVADLQPAPREGGESTTALIEREGSQALFVPCDVTRGQDLDHLMGETERFGGVDVMVCNAGITLASDGADVAEADYKRLMSVNVDGVLVGAQSASEYMIGSGRPGSIILMGSMGGIVGAGFTVAYSTSKGAVVLMAKALADALGPSGVRVNAVCPGTIDTDMLRHTPALADAAEQFRARTPLRRLGTPEEVGNAVAFLGSELSSYVTGTALMVDGGLTAVI